MRALLVLAVGLAAGGAQAATVEELVAKNIQARGGLQALKALQTLKTTGKLQVGGEDFSFELAYSELTKRGNKRRTEASLQGLTAVQAYDGAGAWQIQPFQGRRDPERLSADDAKGLAIGADIEGPLVDSAQKGHKVEYLGTEDVDGTEAHKLKVTLKSGDTQYVYLDPDHFLEIRITTQRRQRGVQIEEETDLGNYEKVSGVFVPFSLESGPKGQRKFQKVTVEKAEANVPAEDALFSFPAGRPAAAPAPAPKS
jgi:outer membrane lipoprotein-sorting protein